MIDKFFIFLGVLVVALPVILVVSVLLLMWRAWWLYPVWGWYLVPLGVPPISFWHFTALLMFVSTLAHQVDTKKDERKVDWSAVVMSYFAPILIWAVLRWMR